MIKNPRVDAFIEKSADFAKPIIMELRSIIEEAHPDITETWKWSFPAYTWKGKLICSYSAFKGHCSFGFWLAKQLSDPYQILEQTDKSAMGSLGRITHLEQLPERHILISYIQEAIYLSEKGIKIEKKLPSKAWEKSSVDFQDYFKGMNRQASSFDQLSPSQRKEYILWIEEAKTQVTKTKRIQTMLDNLLENKTLHWKYNKK